MTDKEAKRAVKLIAEYCESHDANCKDAEGKLCVFCSHERGKYDRCKLYGKCPCNFSV